MFDVAPSDVVQSFGAGRQAEGLFVGGPHTRVAPAHPGLGSRGSLWTAMLAGRCVRRPASRMCCQEPWGKDGAEKKKKRGGGVGAVS